LARAIPTIVVAATGKTKKLPRTINGCKSSCPVKPSALSRQPLTKTSGLFLPTGIPTLELLTSMIVRPTPWNSNIKAVPICRIEDLAEMQAVRYKSTDGLEIPAYLTLPKGVEAKNLPVIVMPHGGPWARDYWGFNSLPSIPC
jgi:hypothetical protein